MMRPNLLDNPRYQGLDVYEKVVYDNLLGMANSKSHQCFITIEHLAKKLGIGSKSISRALHGVERKNKRTDGLIAQGLIKIVRSGKGQPVDGKGCNVYEIVKLETVNKKGVEISRSQGTIKKVCGTFTQGSVGRNNTFQENTFQNTPTDTPSISIADSGRCNKDQWIQSSSIRWDKVLKDIKFPDNGKVEYIKLLNGPNVYIKYSAVDSVMKELAEYNENSYLDDDKKPYTPQLSQVISDYRSKIYYAGDINGKLPEVEKSFKATRFILGFKE